MSLYPKDPKTPRYHKYLQQCSRIQNQLKKLVVFLHIINEQIEKEDRKRVPLTIASKKSNT
jgi:hypothetical protein